MNDTAGVIVVAVESVAAERVAIRRMPDRPRVSRDEVHDDVNALVGGFAHQLGVDFRAIPDARRHAPGNDGTR